LSAQTSANCGAACGEACVLSSDPPLHPGPECSAASWEVVTVGQRAAAVAVAAAQHSSDEFESRAACARRAKRGPLEAIFKDILIGLNEVNLSLSQLSWVPACVGADALSDRLFLLACFFFLDKFRRGCSANLSKSSFSWKERLSEGSALSLHGASKTILFSDLVILCPSWLPFPIRDCHVDKVHFSFFFA